MAEELYNVVFKGELVRSFALAEVKKNLAKLFKVDGPKLDALFSGRPVVLKKNVNFEGASKYRVAIKKAGARVDLQPVQGATPASASAHGAARQVGAANARPSASASSLSKAAAASAAVKQRASQDDGPFKLSPPGALVLEPEERKVVSAHDIDISSLSVKAQSGNLVDSRELAHGEPIDQSGFELNLERRGLAPVGENLVRDNERARKRPVSVDTSGLSIAKPGAQLERTPKPKAPPPPDVSKYRIK